jgi:hypothetical protein
MPEGFFSFRTSTIPSDLLLMLDYGIFYEFIPMDTLEHQIKKATV